MLLRVSTRLRQYAQYLSAFVLDPVRIKGAIGSCRLKMDNAKENRKERSRYQSVRRAFGWLIEVLVSIIEDDDPALVWEVPIVKDGVELTAPAGLEPDPYKIEPGSLEDL